jgi:segregation and condensation protein A
VSTPHNAPPDSLPSDAQALAAQPDAAPAAADGGAIAKLYGEPLLRLPNDLYIPPDALEVILEAFEGPLDLLLYLIRKQNFNILDIPMAQVTLQYLEYIEQIRMQNLELAAEYLLMAAMLIEIKSRMLLPVKKAESGEEAADPRAELVRRLLEYEQMKLAAYQIDTLPQLGRDYVRTQIYIEQSMVTRWPEVNMVDLQSAWADVMKRAKLTTHHVISREELSVREHMTSILRRLQSTRFVEFSDLFDPSRGVPVVVVNFIALLELAKETLIEITQAEAFAPIYVRLAYSPS